MGFNILLKAQLEYLLSKLKPQIRTYATSSTAKDVVDKVATLNGFILNTGAKVTVKFTDTSATSPSSGNISLNVNSTGAKTVISSLDNTACTYEDADNFCGNKTQQFIYDGTNWVWLKGSDSEVVTYTGGDGIQINNNEIKVATNSMFKFVNGVLADGSDVRKFLPTALFMTALANILFALAPNVIGMLGLSTKMFAMILLWTLGNKEMQVMIE